MKRLLFLLGCASVLAGCVPHFKDVDSYNTLFRNDEVTAPGKGDPYTFGGIAEGSGGIMARQSYATDNQGPDFRDATETGKLGEIARDRAQTPGNLPGTTGSLPGTTPPKPPSGTGDRIGGQTQGVLPQGSQPSRSTITPNGQEPPKPGASGGSKPAGQ